MRPCLTCQRPCVGPRCPEHQRAYKQAKYGGGHQRLRTEWEPIVATGGVTCSRFDTDPQCPGLIIGPFDLDHIDGNEHPAHPACNRRAGGQRR